MSHTPFSSQLSTLLLITFLVATPLLALAAQADPAGPRARSPAHPIARMPDGPLPIVCEAGDDAPAHEGRRYLPPGCSRGGIVTTMSDEAARAAIDVLERGGNAMDAAIAAGFVESVASPYLCGIGGSGFLVYHGADGTTAALDFEPRIPLRATVEFFQEPGFHHSFIGHRVVGVPGVVAGFHAAHERLGSGAISWRELIVADDPSSSLRAEGLARNGLTVNREFPIFTAVGAAFGTASAFPETRETYLVGGVAPYPEGSTLYQPDQARSLRLIAEEGPSAFYEGTIAQAIVADMEQAANTTDEDIVTRALWPEGTNDAGLISRQDLREYKPVWRDPLVLRYRDTKVVSAPPPASGIQVLETLNIIEGYPLGAADGEPFRGDPDGDRSWGVMSANSYHALAEAEKVAHRDLRAYLSDPDHVRIPVARLLSPGYGVQQRAQIEWKAAQATAETTGGTHTCTLSVIDRDGNAVAMTFSVGGVFGSGVMAPGTGFVLNGQLYPSELDGRTWGANGAEPGKRPAMSHSPTIVLRDGIPILAVGAAGGELIPMGVTQAIVNVVDFGMDVAHAIDAPRVEAAVAMLYTDPGMRPCNDRLVLEAVEETDVLRQTPTRVAQETQNELARRWWRPSPTPALPIFPLPVLTPANEDTMCRPWRHNPNQEFDDYWNIPVVRGAGIDPASGVRVASHDPRLLAFRHWSEWTQTGVMAQTG